MSVLFSLMIKTLYLLAGIYVMNVIVFNLIQKFIVEPKLFKEQARLFKGTSVLEEHANRYGLNVIYTRDHPTSKSEDPEERQRERQAVKIMEAARKEMTYTYGWYVADKDATKLSALSMRYLEDDSILLYTIELRPKS